MHVFIIEAFFSLIKGVPLTLGLAFGSVLLGVPFAIVLGFALRYHVAAVRGLAGAYVFVFRGTPLLVQLFLIYYGLGQFSETLQALGLWGAFRNPMFCALLALTLNTTAYGAEIVRGGLQSIPFSQVQAARALGLTGYNLYRWIIGPLALRQALPAYGNELILMVKATSLASVVTLLDVTGIAHQLISLTYRTFEVFVAAALIYLAINVALTQLVSFGERALSPDRSPKRPAALTQLRVKTS
jgi:octopine/nopaline transport system permease protein